MFGACARYTPGKYFAAIGDKSFYNLQLFIINISYVVGAKSAYFSSGGKPFTAKASF